MAAKLAAWAKRKKDAVVALSPHAACCILVAGIAAVIVVKPRIFIENPNPCTIAIVPGSVAIAYRTSHRMIHKVIHRIT
jgi:hypothetical protein